MSHRWLSLPKPTLYPQMFEGRGVLALLLILFTVLSVWNNIALPIFEAPDEGDHFHYADFLARERRLPDLTLDLPVSHEIVQPPLYYILTAVVIAPFDRTNLKNISYLNPDWFDRDVNADFRSVTNQYMHTEAERFPYTGAALAVHVARLFSTLLGACVVLLVYATARMLTAGGALAQTVPLLSAALVAFNPKFIHISSIVSNDIAITLAATLACAWMVRMWLAASPARAWLHYLALGVFIGLAMLCKVSGLALLAPALLLIALMYMRSRSQVQVLTSLAALAVGFALTAGPWLVYNAIRYNDPLAWAQLQIANQTLLRTTPLSLWQMAQAIPQIVISYWGLLGIEIRFPTWVDWVFVAGLTLAVIGSVLLVTRKFTEMRSRRLMTFTPTLVLLTWQLVLLASFTVWLRDVTGTENSRLIFPSIAPVTIAVAAGWMVITPLRLRRVVIVVVIAAMLALCIATPLLVIPSVFAAPTYLTQAERAALPGQTGTVFSGKVFLQHAQVNQRSVNPGDRASVILYWGAQQPLGQSYRAILSAHDAQGNLIARLEAIPFNGRYATTRWESGQVFRDEYLLPIDANARRGIATISLAVRGIYETPPLLTVDGASTTEFIIGKLKVLGPLQTVPAPQHTIDASFAAGADRLFQLEGYDLQHTGDKVTATFHWLSHKQTNLDYTLFVHVLDGSGNIIAQEDAQPVGGMYPTSMWDANEQVMDRRSIEIPASAVSMRIGWYLPAVGNRLKASKPDGAAWQDDVVIITLPPAGER
jgi:4-amino-4-deoxy-L-arabinose transferase-like glycosyltransferase